MGLAAVLADLRGRLLAALHPAGPEDDGVTPGGQRPGRGQADARRGAGDDGRATCGMGDEPGHGRRRLVCQCTETVVGRRAKPRTLMEWTRSTPAGSMS